MMIFLTDLIQYWPYILIGLKNTLLLMAIISITGLLGGIGVFYLTLNGGASCRKWIERYISFFIGTPLIVHLFLMYYGLPHIAGIKLSPFVISVIGFTLNVSAYNARHLMTAYNGLERTEIDAARAQGFTNMETFRLIILPQVFRFSVPSLTNQVIHNLKDTSVAFLIQFGDFFSQVQSMAALNFQFFRAYIFAALVYLLLGGFIVMAAHRLEKRIALPGFEHAENKF